MGRTHMSYVCACMCVFIQLVGSSKEESLPGPNSESPRQSSADVIMREDAEEMFYSIDLEKYDGIRCPDPVPPENGAIVGEGDEVGSVVYVQCHKGYRLEGPAVLACVPTSDGAQWNAMESSLCVDVLESDSGGNNPSPPHCLNKPEAGPCRASFKRYYFNKTTMECHTFIYGGCHGNKNNFHTMIDCNRACLGHE